MIGRSAGVGAFNPLDVVFQFGVVGDLSDAQLVQRFLVGRDGADEMAFAALVQRHGPMVLGVYRRALRDEHDAQDAFQATFLVLARRAGSVRKADSVASWLHGVALRIAGRARTAAARRRTHERRGAALRASRGRDEPEPAESWPALHEEIARLPARYREAVVLCYLEGRSTEEAARRLGCPRGTVLSRLSRARERLRDRLVRRGLAPCGPLLAAGQTPIVPSLSKSLLDAAVRNSLVFAGRRVAEAALGSASAAPAALAKGLLHAMTISKLAILGTAALSCALAMGGLKTFGEFGPPGGLREPAPVAPRVGDDARASLPRSVEEIQAEVDATARRTEELKRELRAIRSRIDALPDGPRPALGKAAVARLAAVLQPPAAQAVAEFAEVLKRHAPREPAPADRLPLFMMELATGERTTILDDPGPGLDSCGSPRWSHDGRRIFLDATPGTQFGRSHIKMLEVRDGMPRLTDLGPGNCPTLSQDDRRVAFLLNSGAVPGAEAGVWVMQADGSGRKRVGHYGAPFWSPDGREFLVNDFATPTGAAVIDLATVKAGMLEVPGHRVFSWPSWAGPGRLVACLGTRNAGDCIALLDVRDPGDAKIIEILWKKPEDSDIVPLWPAFWPETGRLVFIGRRPSKRGLYTVRRGESGRAERLDTREYNDRLAGLSFSPDGRYLLFCGNRPDPG